MTDEEIRRRERLGEDMRIERQRKGEAIEFRPGDKVLVSRHPLGSDLTGREFLVAPTTDPIVGYAGLGPLMVQDGPEGNICTHRDLWILTEPAR